MIHHRQMRHTGNGRHIVFSVGTQLGVHTLVQEHDKRVTHCSQFEDTISDAHLLLSLLLRSEMDTAIVSVRDAGTRHFQSKDIIIREEYVIISPGT